MKNLLPVWETDEQFWPKAARDYVFLAAAFHEVGKRLWGDVWTGREALTPPTPAFAAWRNWENANRLARLPEPPRTLADWHESPPRPRVIYPQPDLAKLAEAQAVHAARVLAEQEINSATLARRYKAASWIADHGRNGELPAFGIARFWEPHPLQPAIWCGDDDWALFADCRTKRWLSAQAGSVTLDLFLSKASLDQCLAKIPAAPKPRSPHPSSYAADDAPLLDEMREMIEAGTASGPYPAALLVVDQARGGGETVSKVRRLEKRYIATFCK